MPIIVESSSSNADLFTTVTGTDSRVVGNLDELKRMLASTPDEYAVVLGPPVDLEAGAALADTLRVTRPAVSVILIRRRVDTSVLAEALRSGMREVVEERDLTGLGSATTRAKQVWQALQGSSAAAAAVEQGKLVTVFSPKGGVGKTTIAVNLALGADRQVGEERLPRRPRPLVRRRGDHAPALPGAHHRGRRTPGERARVRRSWSRS